MRVFLAGATGAIGRRLVPLLLRAGHEVTGTTRSAERGEALAKAGVTPAVLDVYDAPALAAAMRGARPEIVIHQLTDLPQDLAKLAESYPANARIRTEGTNNLLAGARETGARRLVVQSIAFIYQPGGEPHPETDPLNFADPLRGETIRGNSEMERLVLAAPGMTTVVLRYGFLYGPGTWYETATTDPPVVHVDAAAQAALLAVIKGAGVYNIAEDDGAVAIDKARRELGFDPGFRLG
jgi:nucleoside-diphosphate-sugar epimerase